MSSSAIPASGPSTTTHRPVTSKPRGLCKYYTDPRGCYNGDRCKFLHANPLAELDSADKPPLITPFDANKRCKFYAQGYCRRGDACWFLHVDDSDIKRKAEQLVLQDDDDDLCSICFEKPTTYGLLGGCSHIFCIDCIKRWRDPQNKPGDVRISGNTKRCPMCRTATRFITPSSRFYTQGSEDKKRVLTMYKESMARVDCRHFQKSLEKHKDNPQCPFGKECFYRHRKEDGTVVVLTDSVSVAMRKYYYNPRFNHFGPASSLFLSHFGPLHLHMEGQTYEDAAADVADTLRQLHALHNDEHHPRMRVWPLATGAEPRPAGARPAQPASNAMLRATRRMEDANRNMDVLTDALGSSSGAGPPTNMGAVRNALLALGGNGTAAGEVPAGAPADGQAGADPASQMRAVRSTAAALSDGARAWVNSIATGEEAEAVRHEDEVMQRLEVLAGQMLASINSLRVNEGLQPRASAAPPAARTDTLPPLEPVPFPQRGRSRTSRHSASQADRTSRDSSASDDSMPGLRSVSNSSESEPDDSVADNSSHDGFDEDGHFRDEDFRDQVQDAEALTALFSGWAAVTARMMQEEMEHGGPSPGGAPGDAGLDADAGREERPSSSARFSTVVDRSASGAGGIVVQGGDDVPQIVPVTLLPEDGPAASSSSSTSSSPAILVTAAQAPVCAADTASQRRRSSEFTTDGRGRVISIGGGSSQEVLPSTRSEPEDDAAADADDEGEPEDSPDHDNAVHEAPSRKSREFTTDGRGRVISVGSAAVATPIEETQEVSSSGGLLGWISALF